MSGPQGRLGACVPLVAVVDELDSSALLILELSVLRQTTNLTRVVSNILVPWNLYPKFWLWSTWVGQKAGS